MSGDRTDREIEIASKKAERCIADLGDNLELREDGKVRVRGEKSRYIKAEDIPPRMDLSKDHWLYGKHAVRVIPCGMTDCTVDAEGNLVPISKDGEPVSREAEDIESRERG